MVELNEVFQFQSEMIERDLTPFTDPGTRLDLQREGRAISARWSSRGKAMEARFVLSADGGIQVQIKNQTLSYRSFLAGPDMADILGLAKMILQSHSPEIFVQTKARRAEEADEAPRPAVTLLRDILTSDNAASGTRIVMVTGEAGAGKTRVLQQLIRQQANEYLLGRTECLYLYLNAQGRALARFSEALATELQDLRSLVTYHAVSALVRRGVLVPVIDGFDELLGVGGYDDAFSSLRGLIEELGGEGQIVASARSSYYEQEFVARANTVSLLGAQVWTQIPIEVLSWGDDEFQEYIREAAKAQGMATDANALVERVARVFGDSNAHLRKKPLFVAKIVDVVLKDPEFHGGDDLLQQLITTYLDRERCEKLLDRDGGTLLSARQLELLFKTLAEEMWNQETRELDQRSIKEVAEYVVVTEGLPDATQRVVIERTPTLAFLAPGEKTRGVAFEHEMFFSYFLSQVLAELLLKEGGAARVFLGRSVLPTEVATAALAVVDASRPLVSAGTTQALLDSLAEAGRTESPRSSQVRENSGLLAEAILKTASRKSGPLKGIRLSRVTFPGGDLCDVELQRSELDRVEFRRVDLSKTHFIDCTGNDVLLHGIVLDPSETRLEIQGLDPASQILGLGVRDQGLLRSLYNPKEIQEVLAMVGAVPPHAVGETRVRSVAEPYVAIIEKLARAYRRTNRVCTADEHLQYVFFDERWPEIERLLVAYRIVTLDTRPTGGHRKEFLRLQVLPDHIMAGLDRRNEVPPDVRRFWDELEKTHPKNM